jgi:hypothetical protein
VRGDQIPLEAFGLTNIEVLDIGPKAAFNTWRPSTRFELASLSAGLTTLTLNSYKLVLDLSLPYSPHILPNLKTLTLHKVDLYVPLQECLKFPKLQSLTISRVYCHPIGNDGQEIREDWKASAAKLLLNASFFQTIPELENLYMVRPPIDDRLVVALEACSKLANLTIADDSFSKSELAIIGRLLEEPFSPNLKSFNIEFGSWDKERVPYTEFVERCLTKRPKLALFTYEYK